MTLFPAMPFPLTRRRRERVIPSPADPLMTGIGDPHTFHFEDGESFVILPNDRLHVVKNGIELERTGPNEYTIRYK